MAKRKVSITVSDSNMEQIDLRATDDERSTIINRSLDRYFAIVQASKKRLQALLDMDDRGVLVLVLENRTQYINDMSKLPQIVEERLAMSHVASKYLALRTKLQSLTLAETACLLDCIELRVERNSRDAGATLANLFD